MVTLGMIAARCGYRTRRIVLADARQWSIALLIAISGCDGSDASSPVSAELGAIHVRITTTGTDLDPDGYLLALNSLAQPVRLTVNGSITFRARVGTHHILVLKDVAANCVVEGGSPVAIISAPGEEVVIDLKITCSAFGHLRISVTTTGTDIDATGYSVAVRTTAPPGGWPNEVQPFPIWSGTVKANGSVVASQLIAGRQTLILYHVAANCGGSDLSPRDVDVVSGDTVSLTLIVTCSQASWIAYSASDPGSQADLYLVRSNGTGATRLTNHPGADEDPAWSPDGARIAFTSSRDGTRAVYVMNEDGTEVTRLTDTNSLNYRPDWSPDGTRIAFVSVRDGNPEIYVMNHDGSNARRLTSHPAIDGEPAWSPDGTRIAFSSARDGNVEIYVMNADGSGVTRVTTNDWWDGQPSWAPDGVRLAFSRIECSYYSCYPTVVVGAPGSAVIEVGVGEDPAWSADGSKIATTKVQCGYYGSSCDVVGIGILNAAHPARTGYLPIWEPWLTTGTHRNPAWRP